MKIDLGRFIKRKEEYDSENIICPIKDYNRDKYLNRRIFIRILFVLIYGYGFGYMLAIETTTIQEIKITIVNFIIFYILSFYLIQIPHEFTHTLFYRKPFKNTGNSLVFFNKKRIVTSELNEEIHSTLLCISLVMPFILFSIVPLIVIQYLGQFDLYLYSLSFANAILSSDDLLNIILQLFVKPNENDFKRLYVIPNNYDYLMEVNDNSEVKAEVIEEKLAESTIESDIDTDMDTDIDDNVTNEEECTMNIIDNELDDIDESIDKFLKGKIEENNSIEIEKKDVSVEIDEANNLQIDNTYKINDLQTDNTEKDDDSSNNNVVDFTPSNDNI